LKKGNCVEMNASLLFLERSGRRRKEKRLEKLTWAFPNRFLLVKRIPPSGSDGNFKVKRFD